MSVSKRGKAAVAATAVAAIGVGVLAGTSGALGGFTASITGQGNLTDEDRVAFTLEQTALTEGTASPVSILSGAQAETLSGASADNVATYAFSANSMLPKTIEPDATGLQTRVSTLKFVSKSKTKGEITIKPQGLTQSHTDLMTGVVDTTATTPASLVRLKFVDNGADGVYNTADDDTLFDNTVQAMVNLSAYPKFAINAGATRNITVVSSADVPDSNDSMGNAITNLDFLFTMSKVYSFSNWYDPYVETGMSGLAGMAVAIPVVESSITPSTNVSPDSAPLATAAGTQTFNVPTDVTVSLTKAGSTTATTVFDIPAGTPDTDAPFNSVAILVQDSAMSSLPLAKRTYIRFDHSLAGLQLDSAFMDDFLANLAPGDKITVTTSKNYSDLNNPGTFTVTIA